LPVVGKTLRTVATVRFCWALELMVRSGVALNNALKPCAEATGNPVFESCIGSCERALSEGETLAAALDRLVFFTPLFIAAVAIGEEAGSLPGLLRKTNRLLELDLEHWFERAGALLEPIALLILGVGVGIVAVGTLLPMVSALQTL
ncbi:MAG: type II secretion system F family protein, partial [Candidatus Eremiobacteraeota bacterium]|nr:type II secretion system F family protein [Candidatus Eremiobacteraeota bacterium]